MFSGALFTGARRERVGRPAERMAASASRPRGQVTPLGCRFPPRDVALERRLTLQAAERAGVKCVVLAHFAEQRAKPGPVLEPPGRDLVVEALEELADARNYLVWRTASEMREPEPDGQVAALVGEALEHLVRAFDVTMRLHDLRRRRAF